MTVPTQISDLSTTISSNAPAGGDSPGSLDDVQRAHAAFIAQLAAGTGFTSVTGTGAIVRATSPTLVTPALGTPASGTLTNCTGLPAAGVTGTALVAASIGTTVQAYDADLTTWAGVTPGAGVATFLATPSSANLAAALTDETGTGAAVFANSPTLVTPALGTPASGNLANCTFPTLNQNTSGTAANLSGTPTLPSGTTLVAPVLGTPASGNLANCTFPTLNQNTTGTASNLSGTPTLPSGTTLVAPVLGTPASGNLANCTFPTLNQNTTGSAGSLATTNWTVTEVGGVLTFKYGGVAKASLDSSGNFKALANVSAYTTP